MLAAWIVGCSLHIGRAPLGAGSAGSVQAVTSEATLAADLEAALVAAAGELSVGPAIDVHLVGASTSPVAGAGAAMEARLELTVEQPPKSATVRGTRVYRAPDPLTAEAARRRAFQELAQELVADGVRQLVSP